MSTTAQAARPRGARRPTGELQTAGEDERPRVYTGRSVEELIPRIERELGHDAIVTRRRSGLDGGVAGFFQRPFVEIEAQPGHPRVDLYDEPAARPVRPPHAETRSLAAPAPAPAHSLARFAEALADAESAAGADEEDAREAPFAPLPASSEPQPVSDPQATARPVPPVPSKPQTLPPEATRAQARLLDRGIERDPAEELVAIAGAHALALGPAEAGFADAIAAVLRRRIPAPSAWPASGVSVALVGPGGAGKTSFCAALAAAYRERSSARVACASLLADREGGHALLLSPRLLEPAGIEEERTALALAQARIDGLLLIDTPALPAADRAAVKGLARLLKRLGPDHVLVALPATYGARAATQLLQALAPLKPTGIAITHAGETDQLGAAVQAACAAGLAPAFLLDARRGGDGLLQTDPADLAARLLA